MGYDNISILQKTSPPRNSDLCISVCFVMSKNWRY